MQTDASRHRARLRGPVTLIVAGLALFAAAPAAQASTLTKAGGVVTYEAAPAIGNDVTLAQDDTTPAAPATLTIDTANDPVTGTLPADCTDAVGDGQSVTCTGVSAVTVRTLDSNDRVDARQVESLPVTADLGDDNDNMDGGNGNDTISGGAGDDQLYGDSSGCPGCTGNGGNDTVDGGTGSDWVAGGKGDDTVSGGDGNDGVVGGVGNDTISGGAGNDNYVGGGAGDDTVNGDGGADYVFGDCEGTCSQNRPGGNDIVNGGDGDDYLAGDDGNDVINGGAGEDYLGTDNSGFPFTDPTKSSRRDPGDDTWTGGPGIDTIEYDAYGYDNAVGENYTIHVRLTQDGQANDGQVGENDNVAADIENINIDWTCCNNAGEPSGSATIVAGPSINSINGTFGDDSIDGGAGNDFVFASGGNDTINARDGYADQIDCGESRNWFNNDEVADADVANVDQFDQVASNCETVNVAQVGNANEDAPPTVSFASPAAGTKLSTTAPTTLTVTAADDKGVTQVVFLDDDRVVCTDTTAPFTCSYQPRGEDVGRNTLVAVAYDAAQQTASAVRTVDVPRFAPKVTAKTTPKRDKTSPFTFTTSGKIVLPANVSAAVGCSGKVAIQIKAGKKTVSTRRATVKKNCTFKGKVTFTVPKRLNPEKLNVFVRFGGNAALTAKSRKQYSVRAK